MDVSEVNLKKSSQMTWARFWKVQAAGDRQGPSSACVEKYNLGMLSFVRKRKERKKVMCS